MALSRSLCLVGALALTGCSLVNKLSKDTNSTTTPTKSKDTPATLAPEPSSVASSTDGRPGYCTKVVYSNRIDNELRKNGYRSLGVARALSQAMCSKPGSQNAQKAADHYRKFTAANGLTEDEALAYLGILFTKERQARTEFCNAIKPDEEDTATTQQKDYYATLASATSCKKRTWGRYDWPDRDYIVRGIAISWCFDRLAKTTVKSVSELWANDLLSYGSCQAQADRYDFDKAVAAVRANAKWNALGKAQLISYLHGYQASRAKVDKHYGKLLRLDPAYKKVMVSAPKRALQAWYKTYKKHTKKMTAAHRIVVDAKNPYVMNKHRGCDAKYFKAITRLVRGGKIKSVDGIKDRFAHPSHALTAAAYLHCEAQARNTSTAALYRDKIIGFAASYGPEDAAYRAAAEAMAANKAAISHAKTMTRLKTSVSLPQWNAGSRHPSMGVVKSLSKTGKDIKVTFKQESWQEPIMKCRETNRIDRITYDGKLIYRRKCKQVGTRTVKRTEMPVVVSGRHAGTLKPGYFAIISRGKPSYPLEVYRTKKRKQLVGILGLRLR